MEFKFVAATSVRAVVSCKSVLTQVDREYPTALKKYGVKKVFLFAECCPLSSIDRLRHARRGMATWGLVLYYEGKDKIGTVTDENMYIDFGRRLIKSSTQ